MVYRDIIGFFGNNFIFPICKICINFSYSAINYSIIAQLVTDMITKKEILKRIKSLEINHISQIDTDYQLDVEVIELFIRTHYAFGDISEIEKDKKVNLLITKVIEKIYENKSNDVIKNNNQNYKKEIEKIKIERVIREKELADHRKKEQKELEKKKKTIQKEEKEKEKILKDLKKKKIKLKDTPDFIRKDKKIIKEVLKIDFSQYEDIHSSLKSSKSFNSYLIYEIGNKNNIQLIYDSLNKDIKKDKKIVEETFLLLPEKDEKKFFQKLPKDLKKDKAWIISLIKNNVPVFHHIDKDFKKDNDIFKAAIMHQYSGLIKTAPLELQNDKEIIAKVVSNKPELFEYASSKIKKDKKFILSLVNEKVSYGIGSIYKFCDESLKKDKNFYLKLIQTFPNNLIYIYENSHEEIKKSKKFKLILVTQILNILEAANELFDDFDAVRIDSLDSSILGDPTLINKEYLIRYLKVKINHNENRMYEYEPYSPTFIKHLHHSLLDDEEIFNNFQSFASFSESDFNLFDKSLIKKYSKQKSKKQIKLKFWDGDPYRFDYIVWHSSNYFDWYDIDEHNETWPGGKVLSHLEFEIINNVFSKLKFKEQKQNKYFNKSHLLPKRGFPTNANGDDDRIVLDYHYDDDEFEDDPKSFKKIKYLAASEHVYEIDKNGKYVFSIQDYVQLQIMYCAIVSLFSGTLIENKNLDQTRIIFNDSEFNQKKIEEFFYIYSSLFLGSSTLANKQSKLSKKKLEKLFLRELNHPIVNKNLKIIDFHCYDAHPPRDEWERDEYPAVFTEVSFTIEYKGIENK